MRTSIRCAVMIFPVVLALAACGSDAAPAAAPDDPLADGSVEAGAEPAADPVEPAQDEADGGAEVESSGADEIADGVECPDGPREVDGVSVMSFHCGPATAEVTTPEGVRALVGGTCATTDDTFGLNFGTVVLDVAAALDGTAPAVDYLGVAIHEGVNGDGTYVDHDMVTVVYTTTGGDDHSADGSSVTLREGRTAGEASTGAMTVEFDCG